jgi:RND family efflux transporter MFP subunit
LLVFVGLVCGGGFWWFSPEDDQSDEITATVIRGDLPIVVTERGELESAQTIDVSSEVEGRNTKIVEILDEGTPVTKDQVVVKFDTEELSKKHAEQEIKVKQAEAKAKVAKEELEVQKNKAESEIAAKELAQDLAELDRKKYLEGDYKVEEEGMKGAIALAERDLEQANEDLEHYRKFVKKGFGTPTQLRVKEQEVERTKFFLKRDQASLLVLQTFTLQRQEKELTAKAEEAVRELERTKRSQAALTTKAETDYDAAEVTADLERTQLEKLDKQLANCVIKAPQNGIVVYSKDRYWDPAAKIRVGAMVDFQQVIFHLPDLDDMQVKVKIHESNVKKVKAGQKAEIRVDAYSTAVLHGTVDKVATIADSRGYWDEGGTKEYVTIVKIDDLPKGAGLKPGMTAEVKIMVNQVSGVLIVPVQAVTARKESHYSYVLGPGGYERRTVSVGENSETHLAIKEGLSQNERVALDARARLAAETESGGEENGLPDKETPGSGLAASDPGVETPP